MSAIDFSGGGAGWRPLLFVALLLGHVTVHGARSSDGGPSPDQVVAQTAARVAQAVADRKTELAADTCKVHALIDELLRPQFDLHAASRLILGPHWASATPEQRERFVAAFYHFLLAMHGTAVLEFRFDTVTVLPLEEAASDVAVRVKTLMKLSDGSRYHVDYYMRPTRDDWKIVDVIAEGVSYVRTYRTDFGAEVRSRGLDALIERLAGTSARTARK